MSMGPTIAELAARARADLRMGLPVALASEGRIALAASAETLSQDRLDAMGPDVVMAITARRAETLKARAYDGDLARIQMPADADLGWVQSVADPSDDLMRPMKGPFRTLRDGSARIERAAIALLKEARLLPAAVVVDVQEAPAGITTFDAHDLEDTLRRARELVPVVGARVPLAVSEAGRVHVFRTANGAEEHYAVEIGAPDRAEPVLSRLHSACFTGDLMDSLKCDCGPQLRAALAQMGEEGAGVLLYLNQEGRGIGLANKMRAYSLQDQGFDTVEANHRLGFEDDERDFRLGAAMLSRMGFRSVRLMTNNPAKVEMMERCDMAVAERVPLKVGETAHNAAYLATKAAKSGHLL